MQPRCPSGSSAKQLSEAVAHLQHLETCPQVVRHGGQFEATVTAETTQLVVLPQSDGAAVTPAALLKAVARGVVRRAGARPPAQPPCGRAAAYGHAQVRFRP